VLADALRALLHTVGGGRPPAGPVAVTHPAHWRPAAVDALRAALAAIPEFQRPEPAPLVSDAAAALTALQDDPGLPTRGVVALCDFGGTGTSITLVDATNGYTPVAPTVRHPDFSGDLVDQALLTHVIDDLSSAGTIDLSGTSAIGSLSRLRAQCRGAKERLSGSGVTTLLVELPGHRSDVRLTRTELDEVIRAPLDDFVGVLHETLSRNGIGATDLAAVASVGGGARIPLITTTLSEHLRVAVITGGQPELTAAIGGGLAAVRGTVEDGKTAMAAMPEVAAAAGAATMMAPGVDELAPSGAIGALAWSDADDVPDVEPSSRYDYAPPADAGVDDLRPRMQFQREPEDEHAAPIPWHRRPAVALGTGLVVVLAALGGAVLYVMRDDTPPAPASTTGTVTTTEAAPTTTAAPPASSAPETQAPPPQTRIVTQAPPVTETVTAPPPTQEPPPPPPEPTSSPPPPTTTEPPATTTEAPPTTTAPPVWSPTAPYPTIPGLPWVPAPQLPGQQVPSP
jgi:hypothetical protein